MKTIFALLSILSTASPFMVQQAKPITATRRFVDAGTMHDGIEGAKKASDYYDKQQAKKAGSVSWIDAEFKMRNAQYFPTTIRENDFFDGADKEAMRLAAAKISAKENPAKYCAERCVELGECEVFEELKSQEWVLSARRNVRRKGLLLILVYFCLFRSFSMDTERAQKFCKECLMESEEGCDVSDDRINEGMANLKSWKP
eukprot:CAMPEP_0116851094 /NCGR_PEP_ID=MMETSP0418-20121206/16521_1 /TAXON_ID=1158023 /ORGANISM="Astrosyne radiata, Strain 13vi08-1A" /LENGTH=200 /DNA_ID=CAMNT_0004483057 /DNA_START=1 /DNA_END=604 /DNA_ORIENTATION=-